MTPGIGGERPCSAALLRSVARGGLGMGVFAVAGRRDAAFVQMSNGLDWMLEESYGRMRLPCRSGSSRKATHGRRRPLEEARHQPTHRREGAPTAAHTPEAASEPQIGHLFHVTSICSSNMVVETATPQAREMIKDPAFWRVDGLPMAGAPRARPQPDAPPRRSAARSRRAFPKEYGGPRTNGANLAGFSELGSPLTRSADQVRACSGGLFGSAVCSSAPRRTTTRG